MISLTQAIKEVALDSKTYGLRGMFRGQGIGIAKAIVSLTMFHQGRIYLTDSFRDTTTKNSRDDIILLYLIFIIQHIT